MKECLYCGGEADNSIDYEFCSEECEDNHHFDNLIKQSSLTKLPPKVESTSDKVKKLFNSISAQKDDKKHVVIFVDFKAKKVIKRIVEEEAA